MEESKTGRLKNTPTKIGRIIETSSAIRNDWSAVTVMLVQHGVGVYHGLQFSQPWKCSSAVASAVHSALPDSALRLQEHAPWSALNDSLCVGQYVFPRLQSR